MTVIASTRPRVGIARLVAVGTVLAWLGPVSMDTYSPAFPSLATAFDVHDSLVQLTLTGTLAGLALGQFATAWLGARMGRRPLLLTALALYVGATVAAGLAPTLGVLVAARVAQGLCAAVAVGLSRTIGRDVLAGDDLTRYFSRLTAFTGIATLGGPVAAGAILVATGSWRAVFAVLGLVGMSALVVVAFALPETAPPRAGTNARSGWPSLLTRRRTAVMVALMVCASGIALSYLGGTSYLLQRRYDLDPQLASLLFSANAAAIIVAGQTNAVLVRRVRAEHLLIGAFTLALASAAWVTITLAASAPLAVVLPALFLVLLSYGAAMSNVLGIGMQVEHRHALAMAALLGAAQYGFGALAAPLVAIALDAPVSSFAVALLAYSGAGLVLALVVRVRTRPSHER